MIRRGHLFAALFLLVTHPVRAAETPNWWIEFKGGSFESAEAQWSDFYGDDRFPAYALAFGYTLLPPIEVGIETAYLADEGAGFAPGHGTPAGNVEYRLYPVHLQLTVRGIFYPGQWLVPYAGAGWSRFNYRIETERQSEISGATSGHQYRAGLQLLMDRLDKSSAAELQNFGIENTYLFLEVQRIEADLEGTKLGGTLYLGGLRLAF